MEQNDFLTLIEQRLAALQARLEAIADRRLSEELKDTIEIARVNQPFASAKARVVLERIVGDIYRRELPTAKLKPLFDMIEELCKQKGLFGSRITADLDYIRIKGNLILHPRDEPMEIGERDAEVVLLLTINLVDWYLTSYLSTYTEAHGEAAPLGPPPPSPYRGLLAFREADAANYFGRGPDVADILAAADRQPLVAVVGPSGSGKSSLAFAGIAARLRATSGWAIAAFRPRARPYTELAQSLVMLWANDPVERLAQTASLAKYWAGTKIPLIDAVRETLSQTGARRLLLIADQFEELYTQGLPPDQIHGFMDLLVEAVEAAALPTGGGKPPNLCLLLTLRADFLGHALGHRGLAGVMDRYPKKLLGPIADSERLRAIIEQPARKAGVGLEDLLVERLLRDLAQLPGDSDQSGAASLPLLEFSLDQLWALQQDRRLTHLGYEELGGLQQALARHADAVDAQLDKTERTQMRQILVQLVRPGEGTEDTRQVATRNQLRPEHWPLVARLADQRLIVTGHDETSGEDTAELIHEALIRHWPLLRDWIDQDRAFRTWQNRLRQALADWEASGKETDALLRGARLAEANERLNDHRDSLSAAEQEYIAGSLAERERMTRIKRRQMRITVAGLATGLLVTIGLSLWVNQERERADDQRMVAEEQSELALARQLAAQATLALTSPPIALVKGTLLAIESLLRAQTLEGSRAWSQAMELLPRDVLRLKHEGNVDAFSFSPNGKLVGTLMNLGSQDAPGEVQVLDINSREVTARIQHDGSVIDMAFDAEERWMATVGMDRRLILTDLDAGTQRYSLFHEAPLLAVNFSPDGELLAIGGEDGSVCIKAAATGDTRFCQRHDGAVISIAFTSDGKHLVSGSEDGTARVWDVSSAQEKHQFTHNSKLTATALNPDGSRLATVADDDPMVRVWDIANGHLVLQLEHDAEALDIAFDSSGDWVIAGGRGRTARIWDAETGAELSQLAHETDVSRVVAISPNGEQVVTVNGWWGEQEAIAWNVQTGEELFRIKHDDEVILATFSPDGKTLITSTEDKEAVWIWDLATKKPLTRLLQAGTINRLRFSPDGRHIVIASCPTDFNPYSARNAFSWSAALVWNTDTGELLHRLGNHPWHIDALAFDLGGERLATADVRRNIKVWNLASSTEEILLQVDDDVDSLGFAPNNKLIIDTAVWDLNTQSKVADFSEAGGVTSFAVTTDGLLVLTKGRSDEGSRLWDVRSGKEVARLEPYQQLSQDGRLLGRTVAARSVEIIDRESGAVIANLSHDIDVVNYAFDAAGQRLAVRLTDYSIALWDIATRSRIANIRHYKPTRQLRDALAKYQFSPDGSLLATQSPDLTVRVWKSADGTLVSELKPDVPMGPPTFRFSNDGQMIATVTMPSIKERVIHVWDVEKGTARFDILIANSLKAFPVFSPDSTRLGFGTESGAQVWDLSTQVRLFSVNHDDPLPGVLELAFSPDGQWLVTAGFDGTTRLWDTASVREAKRLPHSNWVDKIAFANGGRILITRDGSNVARAWDPTSGQELFRLAQSSADLRTIISKDGSNIATVLGSDIRVWETASVKALTDIHHEQRTELVALSSDGHLLATVQNDVVWGDEISEPVRVWEVASSRELFRLEPEGTIKSLFFSADDTRIVTGSDDSTARIWSTESGREPAILNANDNHCYLPTRQFTAFPV